MSGLHYRKDGGLDMRYSSSRAAASSMSYGGGYSSPSSSSSGLHYRKDGGLDMRYSSSKAAAGSGSAGGSSGRSSSSYSSPSNSSSGFHYRKDGGLDMRYRSSKAAAGSGNFRDISSAMNKLSLNRAPGIPSDIPVTKRGLPDMRTRKAKEWVAVQAGNSCGEIPSWVPKRKDGAVDMTTTVAQELLSHLNNMIQDYQEDRRQQYYSDKIRNHCQFSELVRQARQEHIPSPFEDTVYQSALASVSKSRQSGPQFGFYQSLKSEIVEGAPSIDSQDINLTPEVFLGRGAFGTVYKGSWKGQMVAVKKAHLQRLTTKDKRAFVAEVNILGNLSHHPNLVKFYGYSMDPLLLVLEFVELGSLNHLLHYNEDPEVEAKVTDGRIKKKIVVGIIYGMAHLHAAQVVHGDLKPQNILISKQYDAKITDFGLATIRGKTSATVDSTKVYDEDHAVGGTAGYMAPELLGSTDTPELNTDVYSFGVVLNEIISEDEPFHDQYKNFLARGPFAATHFAKLGKRPAIEKRTPQNLRRLIEKCWDACPAQRPSFQEILNDFKRENFQFPNFI